MKKHIKILISGFIIVACLLSIMGFAENKTTDNENRIIMVNGEGKITEIPDIAYVNIGVIAENNSLLKAQELSKNSMNKIMSELLNLKIKEENIKTINYNVHPIYTWNETTSTNKITGYRINNTLQVKVLDINKTGNLLDKVIECGSNNINGIRFEIENKTALYNQALELAIEDAVEKALIVAKCFGVQKVNPKRIDISGYNYYAPTMDYAYSMKEMGGTNISAGTMDVTANVNIEFVF